MAIAATGPVGFDPIIPALWAAAGALALLAVVIGVAWRRPPAVSRGRRAVLLLLRLLAVLAVAMLLLRPVVRWRVRREVPGEVAVLLDATRSMSIRDAATPDGQACSRTEAVRAAFLAAGQSYADLAARCVLNPYGFDTQTRPIGHFAPDPVGPRTDIAQALDFIARRAQARAEAPFSAGKMALRTHLAAVILVSDGQENRSPGAAREVAQVLAARGVPVHAVAVGSAEATGRVRDVAVRDLRAPPRVFAGNRPQIRVVVATLGMKGERVEAVLSLGGAEVERRPLAPAENGTVQELVFTPLAEAPGLLRAAVAVAPAAGELLADNNRAQTTIRVEEGGIRVLYLGGGLHPEGKYAARVLGAAPEMDLDRRILVGGASEGAPQPADLDAAQEIILGDLPASALPPDTIARLVERVKTGGLGLAAVGGLSAYGAGGWASTALAEVLPFSIRAGDGQVAGPLVFQPTAAGRQHAIFGTDGVGAMDLAALPPLSGASAVGPLLPGGILLAESQTGAPLLAVRQWGRGRVAALTVDTTWQWVLAPGGPGGADAHRRFWRQLVLWLAGRDAPPKADLWVMTDRPRYVLSDPERPPVVEVTAHGPDGATPRVRITGPADVTMEPLPAPGGEWRAAVRVAAAGEYAVVAETGAGAATKRAEAAFVVEAQDLEMADILADPEALRQIADAGGGTFRTVDDLARLLGELAAGLPTQYDSVWRPTHLAGGRAFLAAFLAVLAAEWVLRRTWGVGV